MRINPISSAKILDSYKTTQHGPAAPSKRVGGSDRVELSSDASKFVDALKQLAKSDNSITVAPDRLNELAHQIEQGSYSVDSADIANKMIRLV